jgi:regulator of protease activity HflC (stomatin/prohibitin superfamily)
MDVISDQDVAKESLAPGLLVSDHAHEQRPAWVAPGLPMMGAVLLGFAVGIGLTVASGESHNGGLGVFGVIIIVVAGFGAGGFFVVQPNEARVLILFGSYIGSATEAGWWWCNPFAKKQKISLRVRNFQSDRIKVNDASGNPIEIAAVVVWRIVDTAKAVFDVADYEQFVTVQSETSLRHLASEYPYDDYKPDTASLRGNVDEVRGALQAELQARLQLAGIEILETRLTHLAYAPEIAEVMLRRQQAEAILAARRTMVQGAVSLVQMALAQLADSDLVELDPERKATMVSNLMIVLSGDHSPTPVINTGTLYT